LGGGAGWLMLTSAALAGLGALALGPIWQALPSVALP
ncbi:hypothetical protein LCGC14_2789380, partial [marine sediment metagenome]